MGQKVHTKERKGVMQRSQSIMDKPEALIPQNNVDRVLAVSVGGLGDAILFSPVLKALRSQYPHAQIELLLASPLAKMAYTSASELNRATVVNVNHSFSPTNIAELIYFGLRSRMSEGFDVGVFATGLNPKLSAFLKFTAGIRNIACAPNPPSYATDLACNVALANRFDHSIGERDVFVPLTEQGRLEAEEVLKGYNISWDEKKIIAVCPSTDLWYRPRWQLTKLKQVVTLLLKEGFEGRVVIIGSSEEGEEWEQVETEETGEINLAGKLSVLGSAWLISKSCLALCNDGGLMHVAGAVGCPSVVIMPNAPLTYRPPGRRTTVVHSRLTCSVACYPRRPKSCKISECREDITVEEVFQTCNKLS
jgi:heptosyltransferase-2